MNLLTEEKIERISLFRYLGGKFYLLKYILPHIPYTRCYCEPFFGSGKVFFARKPSLIEYINDIDPVLMLLFKVIQNPKTFSPFYKMIKRSFNIDAEFKRNLDDISNFRKLSLEEILCLEEDKQVELACDFYAC